MSGALGSFGHKQIYNHNAVLWQLISLERGCRFSYINLVLFFLTPFRQVERVPCAKWNVGFHVTYGAGYRATARYCPCFFSRVSTRVPRQKRRRVLGSKDLESDVTRRVRILYARPNTNSLCCLSFSSFFLFYNTDGRFFKVME